jgi:hypothetical protein
MKKCGICNVIKDDTEFHKRTASKDGLAAKCKVCASEYNSQYGKDNREKLTIRQKNWKIDNKEKYKENVVQYRNQTRDKRLSQMNQYYQNNKEKLRQYGNQYYIDNKEIYIESGRKQQKKYGVDPIYTLRRNMRSRLTQFRKNKTKKTCELIGCNWEQLKNYLESKFQDGMSWNNYSYYGWHIDHIIPLSSAITKDDIEKLCHYTNLQPLWGSDNLKKSNKILTDGKEDK